MKIFNYFLFISCTLLLGCSSQDIGKLMISKEKNICLGDFHKITFEDNSITDPAERTQVFGQYDHLRIYGQDYYQRLASVGFSVERIFLQEDLTQEEAIRYALTQKEKIPVMHK